MQPLTEEWVDKAEGDLTTAVRELRARKAPNYDAACFHAQQCAEKYLKAVLQERNMPFGKTHHLTALLDMIVPAIPPFEMMRPLLTELNAFAVDYRYPGESADKEIAGKAVRACKEVRTKIRDILGLRNT